MNLSTIIQQSINLIFPQSRCLGCDEPRQIDPGTALCMKCREELELLRVPGNACGNCLSPVKSGQACTHCAKGGMLGLDQAFAPFVYQDLARKLVVQLKFGPFELAAAPLAQEMALCISGIRFDALIPVPLHKTRQRERGMNQSRLLCEMISEQTGLPILDALIKTRKTKRQSSLKADKRADNVKNALASVLPVDGMELLLVDDVRTTGATARECAQVLREAGASSVCLLTAAVT